MRRKGSPGAGPTSSRSPSRSGRPWTPPIPLGRCVEALPSTGGTRTPPRMQRTQRAPDRVAPDATTPPAESAVAVQSGTDAPKSDPQTATTAGASVRNVPPRSVISIPGAPSGLPTRRLPMRSDVGSAAPHAETPSAPKPARPRSCTVDSIPGSMTASATSGCAHALELGRRNGDETHAVAGAKQSRRIAVGAEDRERRATDESPAARRGERVDPGLAAADRDAARGDSRPRRREPRRRERLRQPVEVRKARDESEEARRRTTPRRGSARPRPASGRGAGRRPRGPARRRARSTSGLRRSAAPRGRAPPPRRRNGGPRLRTRPARRRRDRRWPAPTRTPGEGCGVP